jgi:hypothetical protein
MGKDPTPRPDLKRAAASVSPAIFKILRFSVKVRYPGFNFSFFAIFG